MTTRWRKVVSILGISAMLAANSALVFAEGNGNTQTTQTTTSTEKQDGKEEAGEGGFEQNSTSSDSADNSGNDGQQGGGDGGNTQDGQGSTDSENTGEGGGTNTGGGGNDEETTPDGDNTGDSDGESTTPDDNNTENGGGEDQTPDDTPETPDSNKPETGDKNDTPAKPVETDKNTVVSDSGKSKKSKDNSDSDKAARAAAKAATQAAATGKVPSIGGAKGWSALAKEVDKALADVSKNLATDALVKINLNETSNIPSSAFSQIAGKDVTLMLTTKAGVSVAVNGMSVDATSVGNVSVSSEINKDNTTGIKIRNSVTDLTKTVTIFAKADTNAASAVLNIVKADGTLAAFASSPVYDNGYAAFIVPLVSADYVIQ